jgi:hypothetical protein
MKLDTLFPFTPSLTDTLPNRQGRSKKKLRAVIEHDGRVWVARYDGRPSLYFGTTRQEAHNNLQAGGQ